MAHDAQAHAAGAVGLGRQAAPVVANHQAEHGGGGGEAEDDLTGAGVLDGVVDGLAGNEEEVLGDDGVAHEDGGVALEAAANAVERRRLGGQRFEGAHESLGLHLHGAEATGQGAGLGGGLAEHGSDAGGLGGLGRGAALESLGEDFGQETGGRQLLAEDVVQVASDAGALGGGRVEQAALQGAQFGHVAAFGDDPGDAAALAGDGLEGEVNRQRATAGPVDLLLVAHKAARGGLGHGGAQALADRRRPGPRRQFPQRTPKRLLGRAPDKIQGGAVDLEQGAGGIQESHELEGLVEDGAQQPMALRLGQPAADAVGAVNQGDDEALDASALAADRGEDPVPIGRRALGLAAQERGALDELKGFAGAQDLAEERFGVAVGKEVEVATPPVPGGRMPSGAGEGVIDADIAQAAIEAGELDVDIREHALEGGVALAEFVLDVEAVDRLADEGRDGLDEADDLGPHAPRAAVGQVNGPDNAPLVEEGDDGHRGEARGDARASILTPFARREGAHEGGGVVGGEGAAAREQGGLRRRRSAPHDPGADAVVAREGEPAFGAEKGAVEAAGGLVGDFVARVQDAHTQTAASRQARQFGHHRRQVALAAAALDEQLQEGVRRAKVAVRVSGARRPSWADRGHHPPPLEPNSSAA